MSNAIISIESSRADQLAVASAAAPAPVVAYLFSLRSEGSRRTMRARLDTAARVISSGRHDAFSLPWHQLTPAHVSALAAALAGDDARPGGGAYSGAHVNAIICGVRGVMRAAWDAGLVSADLVARLGRIKREATNADPAGRALDAGEIRAVFAAARADSLRPRGARDLALVAILFGAGLRACEAVALDLADLDLDAESLRVVRGKGRKSRVVPLAAGAAEALAAWLAIRGRADGALLTSIDRRGGIGERISTRAVGRIVERLAEDAGVRRWSPHDGRRSYVSALLDAGADIASVAGLAGHASVETTRRYDRRPAEARRRAARLIAVPVG